MADIKLGVDTTTWKTGEALLIYGELITVEDFDSTGTLDIAAGTVVYKDGTNDWKVAATAQIAAVFSGTATKPLGVVTTKIAAEAATPDVKGRVLRIGKVRKAYITAIANADRDDIFSALAVYGIQCLGDDADES